MGELATTWDDLLARVDFNPGDHTTILGATGSGKSTLAASLAARASWVAVIASKPVDPDTRRLYRHAQVIESWPHRVPDTDGATLVLWPPLADLSSAAQQAQADTIRRALDRIWRQGAWTLLLDETAHLAAIGLKDELAALWSMGRSAGVSVVAGTQRPSHIPVIAYGSASHLWAGALRDARDIDRLADFAPVPRKDLRRLLPSLPRYSWLYMSADGATVAVVRPPARPRTDPRP